MPLQIIKKGNTSQTWAGIARFSCPPGAFFCLSIRCLGTGGSDLKDPNLTKRKRTYIWKYVLYCMLKKTPRYRAVDLLIEVQSNDSYLKIKHSEILVNNHPQKSLPIYVGSLIPDCQQDV